MVILGRLHKVDRLSRSLIDFARIVEIFEKYNVSFVSVTQHFNTTNSLGRLTLNILLSFAQFEREIIAERTRDKISAARRKGKWVGGRPVLGYDIDTHGSRLTINADEALQVRAIFKLYLDHNALVPVVQEIDRRGWRTKQWVTRKGVTYGGKLFTKSRLFRLLKNPIYIGKVDFQKQTYDGEHEAIVEAAIWCRVQEMLRRNGRNGGVESRNSYAALLRGLLHCASCGGAVINTYTTKASGHDRYYVCEQTRKTGSANCETMPVSESAIKEFLTRQIRRIGSDPRTVTRAVAKAEEQWRSTITELSLEQRASQRELARLRTELCESAQELGCSDQTVTDSIADLHRRIGQTERRLDEILQELVSLKSQSVDEGDLRTALMQFAPLWEWLNAWEQVQVIRTLIERVVYNERTKTFTASFRSAGIREMCQGAKGKCK